MSSFVPPLSAGTPAAVPLANSKFISSFKTHAALVAHSRCARLHSFGTSTSRRASFVPVCFNSAPDDGDDDYDDEDELQVTLRDPVTQRSITVGIEESFDFDGKSHILCYPIDDPVALVENLHDGELHPIIDEDVIAELYPSARAVCAERDIELKNTAYMMTAEDESEFADEDDDDENDDDYDDDKDEEDEDEGAVEVIAEFLYKEREYMVIRPAPTVWLVAREENGIYMPIRDEQLDRVRETVETILSERELSQ